MEDYVKNIYSIQRTEKKVTTSLLANELSVSAASVTEMIKKLAQNGLIDYAPYRGVSMTGKGEKMALGVIRRHRLLELFLVKILSFSWESVHAEAEKLEHVISDELEHRIDNLLGNPTIDPHGDPIPSREGKIEILKHPRLSDLEVAERCTITRVTDSPRLLIYVKKVGLTLNKKIAVKSVESYDGSMELSVSGRQRPVYISQDVANNIFVERA